MGTNATSKFIKCIIRERKIKQTDMADKLGISKQKLSYMLNDKREIKDTDVIKIAEFLEVTPNELYGIKNADSENKIQNQRNKKIQLKIGDLIIDTIFTEKFH